MPQRAEKVDWEGELADVIGARIHDVDVETARRQSIAGYLIANDVSVRDWQTDNPTAAALAKSYPTHGPLGPWLVTAGELNFADMELRIGHLANPVTGQWPTEPARHRTTCGDWRG